MTVSSIAAEVVFAAGWVAIGAAAAYSRYKKALELGVTSRGTGPEEGVREYHNGLYFGRSTLPEATEPGPAWEPAERRAPREIDGEATAPAGLARLAQALEDAQQQVQAKVEKIAASGPG